MLVALIEVLDEFAEEFHRSYRQYGQDTVYNETGFYYDMQPRYIWDVWMDDDVWKTYLRSLLLPMLVEPSVLLLDNFVSHVSDESYKIVNEELSTHLVALQRLSVSR
ncbi:hypothetical protein DYB37_002645 [Aphanomyces astaci]|uniref:DDE-1 domain-containing protein n=1 Tax=Aphanomyces astaci TaxID=112090 RepID=A0A418FED8_APHAT|nr:hypothetical protein DYB37_002645 [Aphanomyces astaci]